MAQAPAGLLAEVQDPAVQVALGMMLSRLEATESDLAAARAAQVMAAERKETG